MNARRRVGHYLAEATKGLWGRERAVVREELEAHIEARVSAHMLDGMSEQEAIEVTLQELGGSGQVGAGMTEVYAPPVILGAALRGAWRQFRTRVVESLLIVVAVALGVGVVVAVATFLRIDRQIAALATSTLASREISVQAAEDGDAFAGIDAPQVVRLGQAGSRPPSFRIEDLDEILLAAPALDHAYLKMPAAIQNFSEGSRQDNVLVTGVSEGFLPAANFTLLEGSLLTAEDFAEGAPVIVVTREALRRLQITGDPIGQRVAVGNSGPEHTIIGIVDTGALGFSTFGYLPVRTADLSRIRYLYLAVDDPRYLDVARSQVADYVATRWGERVTVRTQPSAARLTSAQRFTASAIAAFASVGLLVASLNVMNLMLARVLRRGGLIGVRRSLGATRTDVRKELLVEGALLGILGGVAGVAVGAVLLWAYNRSIDVASGGREFGVTFSWPALGVGFVLALVSSLVFTLYPANVASRQAIVSALKET